MTSRHADAALKTPIDVHDHSPFEALVLLPQEPCHGRPCSAGSLMIDAERGLVTCTVLGIERLHSGRVLALASVALEVDGIIIEIRGLRITRSTKDGREAVGVEMPHYRAADGSMRPTVVLPDELKEPLGLAVLDHSRELGITRSAIGIRAK